MRHKSGNGHHIELEQFLTDIKTVIRDGQELLRSGIGGARETTRAGIEKTNQLAHEFPDGALAIAFGLGLLSGMLTSAWFKSRAEEEAE